MPENTRPTPRATSSRNTPATPPPPSASSGRQECPRGAPKSKKNLAQFPNAFNSANPLPCFPSAPFSLAAGLLIPVLPLSLNLHSFVLLSSSRPY